MIKLSEIDRFQKWIERYSLKYKLLWRKALTADRIIEIEFRDMLAPARVCYRVFDLTKENRRREIKHTVKHVGKFIKRYYSGRY